MTAWVALHFIGWACYVLAVAVLPQGPWWRVVGGIFLVMAGFTCQRAARRAGGEAE